MDDILNISYAVAALVMFVVIGQESVKAYRQYRDMAALSVAAVTATLGFTALTYFLHRFSEFFSLGITVTWWPMADAFGRIYVSGEEKKTSKFPFTHASLK